MFFTSDKGKHTCIVAYTKYYDLCLIKIAKNFLQKFKAFENFFTVIKIFNVHIEYYIIIIIVHRCSKANYILA